MLSAEVLIRIPMEVDNDLFLSKQDYIPLEEAGNSLDLSHLAWQPTVFAGLQLGLPHCH